MFAIYFLASGLSVLAAFGLADGASRAVVHVFPDRPVGLRRVRRVYLLSPRALSDAPARNGRGFLLQRRPADCGSGSVPGRRDRVARRRRAGRRGRGRCFMSASSRFSGCLSCRGSWKRKARYWRIRRTESRCYSPIQHSASADSTQEVRSWIAANSFGWRAAECPPARLAETLVSAQVARTPAAAGKTSRVDVEGEVQGRDAAGRFGRHPEGDGRVRLQQHLRRACRRRSSTRSGRSRR